MLRFIVSMFAIALVACSPAAKPKVVAVTEVGATKGTPVTVAIGPGGGSISSADGAVKLTLPPDAVSAMTIFTVTPIETKSPGGLTSYRLGPEGSTFANKAKVTFKYSSADIAGSNPSLLSIVFQDTKGRWKRSPATVDEATKTVSTQTSHLSDWSLVRGAQIRPAEAVVEVKDFVGLSVQFCDQAETTNEEDDLHGLSYECNEYDDVTPIIEGTFVEGIPGGASTVGRVTPGAQFRYYAPDKPPAPNPVTVSAEMFAKANGTTNKTILLSRVTVFDKGKKPGPSLPAKYSGSGVIQYATGTGAGRYEYKSTYEVSGRANSVGDYTLSGTISLSTGTIGLPDCHCTITGGAGPVELGLGINATDKTQALAVSANVMASLSCTATSMRTCPNSTLVTVVWSNNDLPTCPGTSTTTFSDAVSLSGGFARGCDTTTVNASWTLAGSE
jgi:hypothetical protein